MVFMLETAPFLQIDILMLRQRGGNNEQNKNSNCNWKKEKKKNLWN